MVWVVGGCAGEVLVLVEAHNALGPLKLVLKGFDLLPDIFIPNPLTIRVLVLKAVCLTV
jgi:hypothetical protein